MSKHKPYMPQDIFAPDGSDPDNGHRVLIAPPRYIQGKNILENLGRYLSIVPATHTAILMSAGGNKRYGDKLLTSLNAAGIVSSVIIFDGECSREEAERIVTIARSICPAVDSIVAVGGGKCVDTGKCVASRLKIPVVICPTLASNDAPCSALSAMYMPSGEFEGIEFFPHSPALVAIDTQIVADAPVRYLVAGMGDAMSTWYEARTCMDNPDARTTLGTRPTMAATALGELCARTLYADGEAAVTAVQQKQTTEALERVVEANTLLSGIGFESGGLAVSHAVAQGLTVIPALHQQYLHGEMVAMGLLTQLVIESREDEARQVAEFFARVGLPIHLGQFGLSAQDPARLRPVMEMAMMLPIVMNEPFTVTEDTLLAACQQAHGLGMDVAQRMGDASYRALHM